MDFSLDLKAFSIKSLLCIYLLILGKIGLVAQNNSTPTYKHILDSLSHYQHHDEFLDYANKVTSMHPDDARIKTHLDILRGKFYTIIQEPDLALELLNRSSEYFTDTQDTSSLMYADLLEGLARVKVNNRAYSEAKPFYLRSHKIRQDLVDESHMDYPVCLHELGYISMKAGSYKEANQYYQKAVSIKKKYLGTHHPSYGHSIMGLANAFYNMGYYQKAKKAYQEAIKNRKSNFGKEHPLVAKSVGIFGYLNQRMGNYDEAKKLYLEALSIREKTLGKNHSSYGQSLFHLAEFYQDLGSYEQAEPLFKEALEIRKNTLGEDHPRFAWSLSGLAQFYNQIGQYEKAEAYYQQALKVNANSVGKNHASYARVADRLSRLYRKNKEYDRAESMLKEALQIRLESQGKNHSRYANCLNSLADIYIDQNKFKEAEPLLLEAIDIYMKVAGRMHTDYAKCAYSLGNLYFLNNNFDQAYEYYLETLEIRRELLGDNHYDYAESLLSVAKILQERNKIDQAAEKYIKYNQIKKSLLLAAFDYLAENEKITFHERQIGSFNVLKKFGLENPSQEVYEEIYNTILFEKGLHLKASMETRKFIMTQEDTLLIDQLEELISNKRKLKKEYDKPSSKRADISSIKIEIERLEKLLARASSAFRKDLEKSSIRHNTLTTKLDSSSLAIEYFTVDLNQETKVYMAAILFSNGKIKIVKLCDESELENLFNDSADSKSNINTIYGGSERGLQTNSLKSLYQLIWNPLEKELANIKTIYYSPIGLLNRINLNAISENEEITLSDTYSMIRLMSTRDLVATENLKLNKTAYTIGGVDFDLDSSLVLSRSLKKDINDLNLEFPKNSTNNKWKYLKWTVKEVDFINQKLSSSNFKTTSFQGQKATEDNFLTLGIESFSPQVIHLATHGYFFSDKNQKKALHNEDIFFKLSEHNLFRSGLLLAGANHVWQGNKAIKGREDGILTAYEISNMNLSNTELVVLSACETGLGDIKGSEGVYGLQRAFKMAGAKFIIMSLWQIPDRQTSEFMKSFYTKWLDEKLSIPDAFNQAQLIMRDRFFDPFSWAGFVLIK